MMKKIIFGVLAMATMFCGCSKDDIENLNSNTDAKGAINFSIGTTRTQYDSDDAWQLEWVTGDKIYIHSPQALKQAEAEEYLNGNYSLKNGNGSGTTGTYSVTPIENTIEKNESPSNPNGYTTNNLGSLTAADNPLYWSAGDATDGRHDFYAAYPASSNVTACTKEGIITFKYNTNQVCKVGSDDVVAAGTTVVAKPDMTNAYMVAATSAPNITDTSIDLKFKPIMTTLDITAQGADISTVQIDVTGITITTKLDGTEGIYLNANNEVCFDVDANTGKIITSGKPYMKGNLNTYISVVGNANSYVTLAGKTSDAAQGGLTVTAFLPPIALKSPNSLGSTDENPIEWTTGTKFALHFAEDMNADIVTGNGVVSTSLKSGSSTVTIDASSKKKLVLPLITTPIRNNWLSLIDNDVYVSQLSIPGTHDAATVNCGLSQGRTQLFSIAKQLDMGIRAFDLRPTVEGDDIGIEWPFEMKRLLEAKSLGNIFHGVIDTKVTMGEVFSAFDSYLTKNPSEFVIVIMRNESYDRYIGNGTEWYQGAADVPREGYYTYMREFLETNAVYKTRKIEFKPNLTVGEMRGKILIISRDQLDANETIETAYTSWNHNNHLDEVNNIIGTGGSTNILIQDMFSAKENGGDETTEAFLTKKIELVKGMMDKSAKFHTDPTLVNTWMINHCSGYAGTSATSVSAYANNANSTNLQAYNYLIGTEKAVGSTGIVMLDYVGGRNTEVGNILNQNKIVYGDLMPQAIIDNNFKYTMKRKTN